MIDFLRLFVFILFSAVILKPCACSVRQLKTKRETASSSGCTLPEPPANGVYASLFCEPGKNTPECKGVPGTKVGESWKLKYSCNSGYGLEKQLSYAICENKTWTPFLPSCGKCGIANDAGNGSTSQPIQYPWDVGLYKKFGDAGSDNSSWQIICRGTLITPHIVLTVSHCVWDEIARQPNNPEEIKVGLGKFYHEWTTSEPLTEIVDVREILIPEHYEGSATFYEHDIALLDLIRKVPVSNNIMPVCVDVYGESKQPLQSGTLLTMSANQVSEGGEQAKLQMNVKLPYVERHKCFISMPPKAQRFLVSDKFCAGYENGTYKPLSGESGASLTLERNEGEVKYHTLIGFVTLQIKHLGTYLIASNISDCNNLMFLKNSIFRLSRMLKDM